ncbi:hypothetical protein ACS0TY_025584 [Phlomoides rotata]
MALLLISMVRMDGHGGGGGVGDKGKATRGRRSWSKMEEDALIQCLVEIVNNGWKADNGFKAGFQRELERGMRAKLPNTDIVANPHINSKIHVWKKEYGAVSDLLSKSGIGWDSSTCSLDIMDESAWDAQKRADPHVKSMRFKSWPYYGNWLDIFGKDRATGEHASDTMDFVNELLKNAQEEQGETLGQENINLGDTGVKENVVGDATEKIQENTSVCKPSQEVSGIMKICRRRKGPMSEMTALVDTLGNFMKSTDESINNLAKRIAPEPDVKHARTNLNDIMKQIPGLSVQDKLKVSDELVQNTARMDFFLTLPPDEQAEYVYMLLDGKIGSMS